MNLTSDKAIRDMIFSQFYLESLTLSIQIRISGDYILSRFQNGGCSLIPTPFSRQSRTPNLCHFYLDYRFLFQYRIPCQERRTKKDGKDTLFSSAYFKALTKKSGRIAGSSPKDAMMSLKVTKEAVPFAQTAKVNGSFFTSVLNTVPDFKVWSPLALNVWEFPSVQQENLWSKVRK